MLFTVNLCSFEKRSLIISFPLKALGYRRWSTPAAHVAANGNQSIVSAAAPERQQAVGRDNLEVSTNLRILQRAMWPLEHALFL